MTSTELEQAEIRMRHTRKVEQMTYQRMMEVQKQHQRAMREADNAADIYRKLKSERPGSM